MDKALLQQVLEALPLATFPFRQEPMLYRSDVLAAIAQPAKLTRHKFWGAGEPDCPKDIKASNGELHTMRCKVCGDDWRKSRDVCFAATPPPRDSAAIYPPS